MCELASDDLWTYSQLRSQNLSRAAISASVAAGILLHVRRGVYAASGVCTQRLEAARHGGNLACVSAARHLGLWVLDDDRPHVWVRGRGHSREHPGCRCVAHWDVDRAGRFLDHPPLVIVLFQIYRCAGSEAFFVAYESALRQRMLRQSERSLLREMLDLAGQDVMDFARSDADSGLESLVRLRLRKYRLTVRTQVRIPMVGRVDLLIGDCTLVEVDGQLGHADATSRHKDLNRDAQATIRGFRTLRFDYAMVIHDWKLVELTILTAVSS